MLTVDEQMQDTLQRISKAAVSLALFSNSFLCRCNIHEETRMAGLLLCIAGLELKFLFFFVCVCVCVFGF